MMINFIEFIQVVLENSCRADEHDCPFARASIEITNLLTDLLKVGEPRKSPYLTFHKEYSELESLIGKFLLFILKGF